MDLRHRSMANSFEPRLSAAIESEGNTDQTDAEQNRLPCSMVCRCLLATIVVFTLSLSAAVYVPSKLRSDELQWWQTSVIYHIYPRSFQDSDGDGIGDIPGIISKLDYLRDLGIGAILLGPMYPSPQMDFGYDVTDHCDVDAIYGTLENMGQLIDQAHNKDLRVIVDFIPNHTSDQHLWFERSRHQTKTSDGVDYKDFFIWSNGRQTNYNRHNDDIYSAPPNNWMSAFGGSAWSWDEHRKQFYFHQFSRHQPDLNYRNPSVIQKMTDVMKFWIEKGVDGFRIDAADFLLESNDLSLNEPLMRDATNSKGGGEGKGGGAKEVGFHQLSHIYTQHQPETHGVFQLWRQNLDEYEQQSGKHIVLIAETFDNSATMNWWKAFYENGAVDMPFNFYLMERTNESCIGTCLRTVVETLIRKLPKDKWLNWILGSHDQKRVSTKYGCRYVNVLNMLNLLLPGTAITYQGEEIGMENIDLTYEETKDPQGRNAGPSLYQTVSRDGCRSPMQWSSAENGGFTSGKKTWLPVHPNYAINNVQLQQEDTSSTWWQYRRLVELRRLPVFLWGELELSLPETTEQIFSFVRFVSGKIYPRYLVIANVGKTPSTNDFTGHNNFAQTDIPKWGKVVHLSTRGSCPTLKSRSSPFLSATGSQGYFIDEMINLERVTLDAGEGLVIEFHAAGL